MKLSKHQVCDIIQSGRFLVNLLGPLTRVGLILFRKALTPLAKNVFVPLGWIEASPATDATVLIKILLGITLAIAESLKDSGIFLKGFKLKMKQKNEDVNGFEC